MADTKTHPKNAAIFLSNIFFCWQIKVTKKRFKDNLNEKSFYDTLEEHKSKKLGSKLENAWEHEKCFKKKPSLKKALFKCFGGEFVLHGLWFLVFDIMIMICQPYYIKTLLDSLGSSTENSYLYGFLVVLMSIFRVLTFNIFYLQHSAFGMKLRIACSSLIYKKILTLKKTTIQDFTLGNIINLLSNDAERLDNSFVFTHFLWIAPVKIFIAIYFAEVTFGHTAVAGVGILVVWLLKQVYVFKKLSSSRVNVSQKSDHRIRLMNDIISGIQVIKMYAWEKPFQNLVALVRKSELDAIKNKNFFQQTNYNCRLYLTRMSNYFCILATVLSNFFLVPAYIFALMTLYENLKLSIECFFGGVAQLTEIRIAIRRIENFLNYDVQKTSTLFKLLKTDDTFTPLSIKNLENFSTSINFDNVSVSWNSKKRVLDDITWNASSGDLVAIIGAAGSGKSTLLQTILKETEVEKGTVLVEDSISYASQDSWIFSGSIKENILFGEELEQARYLRVIEVCALEQDLCLFPFGDNTLVGERGVMLSGGQKARINLARAVYRDANIYLLDDPLSAVDVHVAGHIFEKCIQEYLSTKCVIFVTHQIQFLKQVTKAYILENGKLVPIENNLPKNFRNKSFQIKSDLVIHKTELPVEEKESGGFDNNTLGAYKTYLSSGGSLVNTFLILFVYVLAQVLASGFDYMLMFWHTSINILYVLTGLLLTCVLTVHLADVLFVNCSTKASRNLHDKLFNDILKGSMFFFNNHSSGRILNRFSKDLIFVDEAIPFNVSIVLTQFLYVLGATVIIVVIKWWMLIPAVILYVVFYLWGIFFSPAINDLRRLEAISLYKFQYIFFFIVVLGRSPLCTHVIATVQGIQTVKAFKAQAKLEAMFDKYQDANSSVYYMFKTLYHAFAFWIDLTAVIYMFDLVFSILVYKQNFQMEDIGLVIIEANVIGRCVQYLLKLWSDLDAKIISVERIAHYEDLTTESDNGCFIPSENWPETGNITFKALSLRYSIDQAAVLKNISFHIKGGTKIGIIGRTGSGKTSLISSLFRLFDFNGKIIIDGVNTKTLPLHILRSRISIIPQKPILFMGTLRKNLDPFDQYTDSQLWSALEDVQLKEVVTSLDSAVSEDGSNYSVGQKQLLCLARTILRGAKIVVLDEATANVDLKTDELIQTAIKRKFAQCTVLTVAHRVNTVKDCDKILVLDCGEVVEFGEPGKLLEDQESYFYKCYYKAKLN